VARKKKFKPSDLVLDEEALHELEVQLLMHEVETNSDEDFEHLEEEEDGEDPEESDDEEDLPKKKIKADKSKFYIIPKEFDDAIIKYYDTGVIANDLALMIEKIANKLSFAPNFINYSYKDEMIGDAVIKMFKALIGKKYSHNKGSNPFSYFTRIAFNAFLCRIKKENHAQEIHEKYREELLMFSDNVNTVVKNKNMRIIPT
jgi:hypothetical protein